jgi:hypothetical protein
MLSPSATPSWQLCSLQVQARQKSGVFYFWGHSYEMINDQMWSLFEEKIKRISNDSGSEWGIVADLFA